MFGIHSYNYKRFDKSHLAAAALRQFTGPAAGQMAPDFELKSLNRDILRLRDYRGHKAVVLTFGSVTCPMTAASSFSSFTFVRLILANPFPPMAASRRKPEPPACCATKKTWISLSWWTT
jgi:hypothetical protein